MPPTALAVACVSAILGAAQPAAPPPINTPPPPLTVAPVDPPRSAPPADAKPVVAFPHPLITEILYAVPGGDLGDANKDGQRDAIGDEFIELFNPHDKPINLKGYHISDKSRGKKSGLSFTFPSCELKPGQIALLFNGHNSRWTGPVGDAAAAPTSGHPKFDNALVFTMKNSNKMVSLSNAGDCVILLPPGELAGTPVQVVKWGKFEDKLPECPLTEDAPTVTKCSVQRATLAGPFVAHDSIDGLPFSPGRWSPSPDAPTSSPPDPQPTDKPADSKDSKPKSTKPASKSPPR